MDDASERSLERALSRAVAAGDPAAWQALYERHFAGLYGFVHCREGGRKDRIEDVLQDCWLVAVRRIRDFDPDRGDFAGWLRGIAGNVLHGERRRRAREGPAVDPAMAAASAATPADPRPAGLSEEIAVAFSLLPASYQQVLKAKYENNLSVAQIAERWGRTVKTIESLLSRARAAFREAFSSIKEAD